MSGFNIFSHLKWARSLLSKILQNYNCWKDIIKLHQKNNIRNVHSGMSFSNNCIKMYIHRGLSVFPNQGLPKTETKYFKWPDCGRWHPLIFSGFSWMSRGLWELVVYPPAPCQREILLVTDDISGENGVDISPPLSFVIFPCL